MLYSRAYVQLLESQIQELTREKNHYLAQLLRRAGVEPMPEESAISPALPPAPPLTEFQLKIQQVERAYAGWEDSDKTLFRINQLDYRTQQGMTRDQAYADYFDNYQTKKPFDVWGVS